MRLSDALSRKILDGTVGRIIYSFGGKSRRHTLFFEDIFAEYVKKCQDAGYTKELREIGTNWMGRVVLKRIPKIAKKISPISSMNLIIGPNLINIGLMDYLHVTKRNGTIILKTKNEAVTRIIGQNEVVVGIYSGILSVLFDHRIKPIRVNQSKKESKYIFEILSSRFNLISKDSETYVKLNELPKIKGISLKNALKDRIFKLKGKNRIYFKSKPIGPIENTVFHLFGIYNLLFKEVPIISFDYFNELIDKNTSIEKKLFLLKTLLQTMGWGIVTFTIKSETEISMEIRNPPYGLQPEKDNWIFLINVILGYLWIINKKFKIDSIKEEYKRLVVDYRITQ